MDNDSEKNPTEESPRDPATIDSVLLLDQYISGDSQAASLLFDRYVARLIGLARSRMSLGMRRRADPEDAVHSAYRRFFVHAAEGDFVLGQSGDLWRLLAQITLNKVRKQAERHTAARRDFRRDDEDGKADFRVAVEPTPEEAVSLVEQVRLVAERLSADERFVLSAHLQGDSIDAIAHSIGKSPRTVRRALARARSQTERQLLGSMDHPLKSECEDPLDNPLPYSDFRLERPVGAGGMGKVYRATQQSTGEVVAVKALRKDRQTDSRAVKQFLQEAALMERLDHPGIVRVRGLGRFPSGGYFIVMDCFDGHDLQVLIDSQRLTLGEAVNVVERVAEAVAFAHEAGVVHCDLKPANILLGSDDQVAVTDFGFAQIVTDGAATGSLGGTLGYLAPELLRRDVRPTPAADVYSLGRVLQRVTPSEHSSLHAVCEHCLMEQPDKRPQTAADFLRLLRAAAAEDQSAAEGLKA